MARSEPPVREAAPTKATIAPPDSLMQRAGKTVFVRTDRLEVKISTAGGDVVSVRLRGIYDKDGREVELAPRPLGGPNCEFVVLAGGKRLSTAWANFIPDKDSLLLSPQNPTGAVTMVGVLPDGTMVQRRYEFECGVYHFRHKLMVAVQDTTVALTDGVLWWRSGFVPTEANASWDVREFAAYYSFGGETDKVKPSKRKPTLALDGATQWLGATSKYFAVVLVPDRGFGADGLRVNFVWYADSSLGRELPAVQIGLYYHGGEPRLVVSNLVYAGPRDYFILRRYGRNISKIVDLGWWWLAPITKALLWVFRLLYAVVPNYGWVIVIFTVLMKLLFTPVSHAQLKSMKRMRALQPQLRSIQERFRDDPQRMNAEIMKLYRKHGVSPFSGCLPLLVQMPVFFALYRALASGFQFRAKPFVLWIKDLSQKDPYYVLPLVMAATMFVQQKISTTDPKQKPLAYIMPLFFLLLFKSLPAGLVLYWTVFNILSVIHMLWVEHKWEDELTKGENDPKEAKGGKGG